jgi:hypothetical protein
MIITGAARPLCIVLTILIATPCGFAQAPPPAGGTASSIVAGPPLNIGILEGKDAVNSISLLRAVAPVVEIRDQNDFPVEGATVVFTLPAQGTGGTFAGAGTSFSTRSDSHGQAAAPPIVPRLTGKFQIKVTASAGDRKGEAVINQTNTMGAYVGPALPGRPFYKKKLTYVIAGGAVAAVILAIVLTHHSGSGSSSNTIVITPGTPVFQ